MHFAHGWIIHLLRGVGHDRKFKRGNRGRGRHCRLRFPNTYDGKRYLTLCVQPEEFVDLLVHEAGNDSCRKIRRSGHSQEIGEDGAVVPAKMTVCARVIFPGIAPISSSTDYEHWSLRNRRIGTRRVYDSLTIVPCAQLAKTELGRSEVIYAGRECRRRIGLRSGAAQIATYDIKLDFIESARASGRAEEGLALWNLFAACNPR